MSHFPSLPTERVVTSKMSSSLLVIDSDDRNVSTDLTVNPQTFDIQPWNNFQITTPDRLMTGAVTSLMLKEVVFPWAIPNITSYNNVINVNSTGTAPFSVTITIPPGFYVPSDLVTILNAQLATYATVSWSNINSRFTWTILNQAGNTVNFDVPGITTVGQYVSQPSLLKTLGFSYAQWQVPIVVPAGNAAYQFNSSSTSLLYTSYVDIVSSRINQYRKLQDGASKNASRSQFVTRLYCANETSTNPTTGNPVGTEYFVINRQVCEKVINWEPHGTIDVLDFQVRDEYGNLVWIPVYSNGNAPNAPANYPSFKMTFVAVSEN